VDHKLVNEQIIMVTNSISDMKLRVKNGESVKTVYSQTQNKFLLDTGDAELTAQQFPNLISVKSSLYNEQRKVYPSLPKTLNELIITGQFNKTILDARYLVQDVKVVEERIVVFTSDTGIEILCKSKRGHDDGTFDVSPPLFTQVYLIHAWYKRKMFPCALISMTGKSFELHKKTLQILKDQALENGLVWDPESIMTDFEQASIKAFKYHFPIAKLLGCYFHFAQCLWRKSCEIGMKTKYERADVKVWFKKIVALPLFCIIYYVILRN
jgi:hypothetical protein